MKTLSSLDSPLRVDFLPPEAHGLAGRLGMTFAPGKKGPGMAVHWDRDLTADLDVLVGQRCQVLVSLLEDHEFVRHQIPDLLGAVAARGIRVVRFPIPDLSIPSSTEALSHLVATVLDEVRGGNTVVVHCLGGKGRTGLVVACCLVALGREPRDAVATVRRAREGTVETTRQEQFVSEFATWLRQHPLPVGGRAAPQDQGSATAATSVDTRTRK